MVKKILKFFIKNIQSLIVKFFAKGNYTIVNNPDLNVLKVKYNDAWKNQIIPRKQLNKLIAAQQLEDYTKIPPMKAIVDLLKKINTNNKKVLEIGCSSGYYSEVFKKAGFNFTYEGCDYSEEFIKMAKQRYPEKEFKINDATDLNYTNNQFNIVISGCCILHIIDYKKAISETARTAKDYVIFHRTPVIHKKETTYAIKTAYGTEMVEIFFNEEEIINLFYKNSLSIISINTHSMFNVESLNEPVFMKSYLCKKI